MIATDLEHINNQLTANPLMKMALDFLRRPDLCGLPDGEVEIDGRRVFAIVQRYRTAETSAPKFEFHRTYIDIQYLASGAEAIGWAPSGRMAVTEAYDADKDICFGTVKNREWTSVNLSAGQLAVFYPEDAHAPKLAAGASTPVNKIVVKVEA